MCMREDGLINKLKKKKKNLSYPSHYQLICYLQCSSHGKKIVFISIYILDTGYRYPGNMSGFKEV